MALGRALDRRIGKSESLPRACSIDDKWSSIHDEALQSLSEEDQRHWRILEANQAKGDAVDLTLEQQDVAMRYHDAFLTTFTDHRLAVGELDDLLSTSCAGEPLRSALSLIRIGTTRLSAIPGHKPTFNFGHTQ